MQPLLKLVTPDAANMPATISPESITPRVLPAFAARLTLVTQAERALRAMGLRVVAVTWAPRPVLQIVSDRNASIGPLLDRMGSRRFVRDDTHVDMYGDFQDVTVWWQLPAHATSAIPATKEH